MGSFAFTPGPKGQEKVWKETSPGVGRLVRPYGTGKYGASYRSQMKAKEPSEKRKVSFAGYDPSEGKLDG